MTKHFIAARTLILFFLSLSLLTTGCGANMIPATSTPTAIPSTATPIPTATATPFPTPKITSIELDRSELPKYESLEFKLAVEAQYTNPYDARQVTLDGIFTGPDGKAMTVPGFWDNEGAGAWRIRFTPSQAGEWRYQLIINNGGSPSAPAEGKFNVTASDLHGWLQVGQWVNPDYSRRYLVYHDGTPFYGVGHGDALNILADRFTIEGGVGLFNEMKDAGENYVVWWPLYIMSPINDRYDAYSTTNTRLIDVIVKDAQKKGVFLIFTVWDHPELRGENHPWGTGNWVKNGFSKLGDIESFFISDEAWAWQENFYRYLIARWGYSLAIGMWQTVSEINGTSSYEQTNPWHEKVNAYFVEHDPYRHPTTASMSGDVDWPEGHRAMDAPQVHVYNLKDPVRAALTSVQWTRTMWKNAEKPNWIGEYGVPGNAVYPEMFHNFNWAALASGAALTPAEWNDRGSFMQMSPEMYADNGRLAQFVSEIPLAQLNPSALQIASSDAKVRGWGVAGKDGGLFWVQDFSMEGAGDSSPKNQKAEVRRGVQVGIEGMAAGTYTIQPYDTWQGEYLKAFDVDCPESQPCQIKLPNFTADMAFKIERK